MIKVNGLCKNFGDNYVLRGIDEQINDGEVVVVIGPSGSGKSTFSKALRKITGIPLYHLDMMFWNEDRTTVAREILIERLQEVMKTAQWIIDGNYNRTIPMRLKQCDTVIYLDYPTYVSFFGALKRVIKNYGKVRDDMGGNCKERFDPASDFQRV